MMENNDRWRLMCQTCACMAVVCGIFGTMTVVGRRSEDECGDAAEARDLATVAGTMAIQLFIAAGFYALVPSMAYVATKDAIYQWNAVLLTVVFDSFLSSVITFYTTIGYYTRDAYQTCFRDGTALGVVVILYPVCAFIRLWATFCVLKCLRPNDPASAQVDSDRPWEGHRSPVIARLPLPIGAIA